HAAAPRGYEPHSRVLVGALEDAHPEVLAGLPNRLLLLPAEVAALVGHRAIRAVVGGRGDLPVADAEVGRDSRLAHRGVVPVARVVDVGAVASVVAGHRASVPRRLHPEPTAVEADALSRIEVVEPREVHRLIERL